jgi:O-antigen/teichoic acid export membrane protein
MNPFDKFKEYFLQIRNITTVGISTIIANGISGIFWIYLASVLGVEKYGELGYMLAVIGISGGIASFGTVNAMIVYVSKGEKIQATLFFIVLCSATIVGILSFIIFKNEAMAIYPLGYVIFSSVIFDLLGKKSFANYGKIMVLQRIIMVVLVLVLYQQYEIYGIVLGYSLSFFPFVFLMYKGFKESRIDFSILKGKINFITTNYVTHMSKILNFNIDKLIIFPLFGTAILGPYQLAFQIFILIMLIPNTVLTYTLPHDAIGIKNIKLKKYTVLFSASITIIIIIFSPIIIPEILPQFEESIQVIQIMSLAFLPSSLSILYSSELLGSERSKVVLVGTLISVIILSSGILLLGNDYGLLGITITFVIAKIAEFLFLHIKK